MTRGLALSDLEIASGHTYGLDDAAQTPPAHDPDARGAFEAAVRTALLRPPCVVAFSGGRDSAVVLAAAVAVARREGLAPPIALTLRFPAAADSEESSWQELVVRHLGVSDWTCISLTNELECLGPVAQAALRRHGLLWPANIHSMVPGLEAARGGSLLTGHGGDELLHPGRHARIAQVLAGRAAPTPRDAVRLLFAASPRSLRVRRRRGETDWIVCPWLRPHAVERLVEASARLAASEPVRRDRHAAWVRRLRAVQLAVRSMEALGSDTDTQLIHPFLDENVVTAYGAWARRRPPASRTDAIARLFGDLLPEEIVRRRTKATFDGAFWGATCADFAATLAPDEVDSDLVDGARAIEFWLAGGTSDSGPVPSALLLQSLWLRRAGVSIERGEEPGRRASEGRPVATSP